MNNQKSIQSEWEEATLMDLGIVARGKSKHRPRNDPKLYGGKYPFIQTSDIKNSNYYVDTFSQTYNENGLAQSKLWGEDTLCITIAANIAENAVLKFSACFPDSVVGFTPYSDKSDVRFVKYALDYTKQSFQNVAQGAAQDNLSLEKIQTLKLKVPPLPLQKTISDVIHAYDLLIENNEKRIKILEEMAQHLYTEWCVKFKFPGYEKLEKTDSGFEYGEIPEGWRVVKLGEVADIVRGCSYSTEEIDDFTGEYYLVNLKSFNRGGGFRFDGEKYFSGSINSNQSLKTGDVVVAVTDMTTDRAVIAHPARIPELEGEITFSADVVKINSDILPKSFIYQLLSSYRFTETTKQMANGANVLHLKPSAILEFVTVIPDTQLLNSFDVLCEQVAREIDKLLKQNDNLLRTRDLLIPQLVTGKRDLKN